MIFYQDIPDGYYAFFGLASLLLALAAVWLWILTFSKRMKCRYLVFSGGVFAVTMFMLQGITDISVGIKVRIEQSFFAEVIGRLQVWRLVILLVFLTLAEGIILLLVSRNKGEKLTAAAMKESLDALPDGICFFTSDGQTILANVQMQRISRELFHTELLNGKVFWEGLQSNAEMNYMESPQTNNSVLISTEDGKVWDVRHEELEIKHHCIFSLIACDVTEQYRINEELIQRNKIMEELNERLRNYSFNMDEIVREKEIMEAKIKVHDDVGRAILAFHAYLEQPVAERNREQLLLLWRYTISVMKNEEVSSDLTSLWGQLLKAAKAVDVEIVINGDITEEEKGKKVLLTALHECLTNTVKHANGNRLFLSVEREETEVLLELKNNGKKPTEPIQETGGLKNLRHLVEETGGRMEIDCEPEFVLRLRLPKEEKENV